MKRAVYTLLLMVILYSSVFAQNIPEEARRKMDWDFTDSELAEMCEELGIELSKKQIEGLTPEKKIKLIELLTKAYEKNAEEETYGWEERYVDIGRHGRYTHLNAISNWYTSKYLFDIATPVSIFAYIGSIYFLLAIYEKWHAIKKL